MTWIKELLSSCLGGSYLYLVAVVAGAIAGAGISALHYKAEISDIKTVYAIAAERHQTELLKKERENAEKLAQAANARQAEVDKLNNDLSAMRSDTDRVRIAVARSGGVSSANKNSCGVYQRQVRECVGLLAEGAGLLEESGGLLRDFNADREAVRKMTSQKP